MALFCVQIDYFAMNLALPRMAFDLKTTAPDLQWVISVYMLALGAFMVPAGASVTSLVAVARCWQASHCSGCPPRCVRWGRRRHSSSPSAPSRALVPR